MYAGGDWVLTRELAEEYKKSLTPLESAAAKVVKADRRDDPIGIIALIDASVLDIPQGNARSVVREGGRIWRPQPMASRVKLRGRPPDRPAQAPTATPDATDQTPIRPASGKACPQTSFAPNVSELSADLLL